MYPSLSARRWLTTPPRRCSSLVVITSGGASDLEALLPTTCICTKYIHKRDPRLVRFRAADMELYEAWHACTAMELRGPPPFHMSSEEAFNSNRRYFGRHLDAHLHFVNLAAEWPRALHLSCSLYMGSLHPSLPAFTASLH